MGAVRRRIQEQVGQGVARQVPGAVHLGREHQAAPLDPAGLGIVAKPRRGVGRGLQQPEHAAGDPLQDLEPPLEHEAGDLLGAAEAAEDEGVLGQPGLGAHARRGRAARGRLRLLLLQRRPEDHPLHVRAVAPDPEAGPQQRALAAAAADRHGDAARRLCRGSRDRAEPAGVRAQGRQPPAPGAPRPGGHVPGFGSVRRPHHRLGRPVHGRADPDRLGPQLRLAGLRQPGPRRRRARPHLHDARGVRRTRRGVGKQPGGGGSLQAPPEGRAQQLPAVRHRPARPRARGSLPAHVRRASGRPHAPSGSVEPRDLFRGRARPRPRGRRASRPPGLPRALPVAAGQASPRAAHSSGPAAVDRRGDRRGRSRRRPFGRPKAGRCRRGAQGKA